MAKVRTSNVRDFHREFSKQFLDGEPVVVFKEGIVAGSWYPGMSGIAVNFTGKNTLTPDGHVTPAGTPVVTKEGVVTLRETPAVRPVPKPSAAKRRRR